MAALAEVDTVQALLGMDPPTQLAEQLLPPLKQQGWPFDRAWDAAIAHVCWPASGREARDWRNMLYATREGWRAAYDGEPPTREEWVLSGLASGLAAARAAAA